MSASTSGEKTIADWLAAPDERRVELVDAIDLRVGLLFGEAPDDEAAPAPGAPTPA